MGKTPKLKWLFRGDIKRKIDADPLETQYALNLKAQNSVPIHLLFIGDLFIHKNDFLPFLNNHGYEVTVVETSTCYTPPKRIAGTEIEVENLYNSSLARKLFRGNAGWFTKAGVYTLFGSTRLFSNRVQKIIKQKDVNIIYGSWGSPDLPEMRMVQKLLLLKNIVN